ncbi:MAG: hypothetical protein ABR543_14835 [Gemmatimonadaceae bacterium]
MVGINVPVVGAEGLLAVGHRYKRVSLRAEGDAYNLFFEQFTFRLGTREFVMYNPRDQQVMTSHKMDLLQLTPEELALDQTRGHNAVHDAPHPHWKYFWFD